MADLSRRRALGVCIGEARRASDSLHTIRCALGREPGLESLANLADQIAVTLDSFTRLAIAGRRSTTTT